MTTPSEIGQKAEDIAAHYLEQQGLSVVARNYQPDEKNRAEIDLIMRDGQYYVFVEVKFRTQVSHGDVLEQITPQQQSRLIYAAKRYLLRHYLYDSALCRFDVVGITPSKHDHAKRHIVWIKDAFWATY